MICLLHDEPCRLQLCLETGECSFPTVCYPDPNLVASQPNPTPQVPAAPTLEQLAKDAERYRWLRSQFKLVSETQRREEFVQMNKNGQKVYEVMESTFHHYVLQDDWRFGANVDGCGTAPTFDKLVDAAMGQE